MTGSFSYSRGMGFPGVQETAFNISPSTKKIISVYESSIIT